MTIAAKNADTHGKAKKYIIKKILDLFRSIHDTPSNLKTRIADATSATKKSS